MRALCTTMPSTSAVARRLHVVDQDRRVGQDHALDGAVRDVALVPQRDVLDGRLRVAAQHAREPGDLLGLDRVSLVRHREEPFCPLRNGSSASRTSVRWRWRSSVAKRSSPAPASAIACSSSAWRSRATTCVETGSRSSPIASSTRDSNSGDVAEYVPTAPRDRADRRLRERALQALGVAVRLEREAGELDPERRRLGVHAVRAPDAQRLAVLARPRGERRDERARARHDDLAGALELQRQRRVEHVARRQPVVDPAPGRPGRSRQHVDEGGHVVVGRPLALVDRLDRERRGADRVEIRAVGPSIASADLDVAPADMRASSVHGAASSGRRRGIRAPISGRVLREGGGGEGGGGGGGGEEEGEGGRGEEEWRGGGGGGGGGRGGEGRGRRGGGGGERAASGGGRGERVRGAAAARGGAAQGRCWRGGRGGG